MPSAVYTVIPVSSPFRTNSGSHSVLPSHFASVWGLLHAALPQVVGYLTTSQRAESCLFHPDAPTAQRTIPDVEEMGNEYLLNKYGALNHSFFPGSSSLSC